MLIVCLAAQGPGCAHGLWRWSRPRVLSFAMCSQTETIHGVRRKYEFAG